MQKRSEDKKLTTQADHTINAVYDRHVNVVYRVCFSLMGNKQDAEDAVQSVFIKLMENGKLFADTEHEKAWLIVTAQNHCRDLLRKWWRKKVVDLDAYSIEQTGLDTALSHDLADKLRKLPSTYRLILYLHYYEGYKVAEIANMLKLNIITVKTQMRNGRKRLKLEIGDDLYE
ncbi:RNA polymerase sigma factor [Paenibacillus sp. NPDC058174]|uniref:RNA polymerase sigma factor n=1 Tax=Paenibacillus sp. NPDC058174 TaxID=3346366 RepID=UPI0036DF7DCA